MEGSGFPGTYSEHDFAPDWLPFDLIRGPEEFSPSPIKGSIAPNPSSIKGNIAPKKPQNKRASKRRPPKPCLHRERPFSPSCEYDEDLVSGSSLPSLSDLISPEYSVISRLSNQSYRYCPDNDPFEKIDRDLRISLGLTQQKISILKDAFACVPDPSPSDYDFLARCLDIPHKLDAFSGLLFFPGSKIKPRKVQNRPVANWKVKIIRRGVGLGSSPADGQLYFLAAGLRLDHLHLKQLFKQAREKEEHASDAVSLPRFVLQTKPAKQPITATPPAEAAHTSLRLLLNNAIHTYVDDCPKIKSDDGTKTPSNATGSNDDEEEEEEEEDERELCPETEVAAIVGPEHARLAPILAQMSRALLVKALPSSPASVIGTPASSFNSPNTVSDTSDASSSPSQATSSSSALSQNTPLSSPGGGQKRKANEKGNDDGNSGDEAGDGDDNGRAPKRSKTTQTGPKLRYSCPVARRVIHMEQIQGDGLKSRGCAPDGLEFRHVWFHLLKSHFGCEVCHTKFKDLDEGTTHLLEAKANPEICKPTEGPRKFEIGFDLCLKLKAVYLNKKLDHHQKWIEWWNLLCPGVVNPDPLHAYTVSLSTADIPKVAQMFQCLWKDTPSLPELDEQQTENLSFILDKVIRLLPRVERPRQRRRPGTQQPQPQDPQGQPDLMDLSLLPYGFGNDEQNLMTDIANWDPSSFDFPP